MTFCLHYLTATWTEHWHYTGNINLPQRWEFWININNTTQHSTHIDYRCEVQYLLSIEKEGFGSENGSSLARWANKVTFSWCWQSLVGKKLCLVLSWLQHFWSLEFSIKVLCDKDWDKINAKHLFVLGLVLVEKWISSGQVRPQSELLRYQRCHMSQSGHLLAAGTLSHFIVWIAQVFDCEYFSWMSIGLRINEIVCPLLCN